MYTLTKKLSHHEANQKTNDEEWTETIMKSHNYGKRKNI